jgi:integrase
LATGARYGELIELRASDFNPDSGTVHVRTSKSGKGRHIVLNDEGMALFKALAAGKSGVTKPDGGPWMPAHQANSQVELSVVNHMCPRAANCLLPQFGTSRPRRPR